VRLVFALLLPINTALFFFPEPVLKLINPEYIVATNPLKIYISTNIVLLIIGLITTHIYAIGNYIYTLLINIASNITRMALYTVLTPIYGAIGAATSYLAGTLTIATMAIP